MFDADLKIAIQEWLDSGDQIILSIDLNSDARHSKTARMIKDTGLQDVILQKLLPDTQACETQIRNNRGIPIDALFVTPGINPSQGGHMPHNAFVQSDHRSLWIDVPFESALDFNPPDLHCRPLASVKVHDPRSRDRFIKLAHKAMDRNPGFQHQLQQLQAVKSYWSD